MARARQERPSNTGAYNQAWQALPLSLVQQSCDRIFEELIAGMDQFASGLTPRAFVPNASPARTAHTAALRQSYPPGSNQHCEGHWPLLRSWLLTVCVPVLAMRPEWGPMHGPDAVSEQQLLERAIHRLPSGSTLIGDANVGVFSVAYAGERSAHPVLPLLTAARAEPGGRTAAGWH